MASAQRAQIRVGISGWRYPGWRGDFYPPGLPQRRELEFAARHFDSIELNGSFYSLQRPEHYAAWYADTPPGFVFAVKGSRYITHMRKLREIEAPLANFFASGLLCLEDKLGPILWQFPPQLAFDERLEAFIRRLPRDTEQAAALARQHDARLLGRSSTRSVAWRALRHCFEVRHPSFACPELISLLRRHGIGLVVADSAGRWPYLEDVTADFMYVRLHGDVKLYESGYSRVALRRWAERVHAWSSGNEPEDARRVSARALPLRRRRDVYVYFDNDMKVRAPYDALALRRALGLADATARRPTAPASSSPGSRPRSKPGAAPSALAAVASSRRSA
jgi:uncharacterized protein YecE (DUF72 family)